MRPRLALLPASFAALLGGCVGAPAASPISGATVFTPTDTAPRATPAPVATLLPGFQVTNYTLAREDDLAGERSGKHARVRAAGLSGTYAWEFLCSGRGVAMQGTGLTHDGRFVHYVSGGGGFCGRDHHLCHCSQAKFATSTGVFGAAGRALVEDYSIAVDPDVIPFGSFVWIDAMKRWFRADDKGGAIRGNHIDVYVGTRPMAFTGETDVFVSAESHAADDPPPPGVDAACPGDGFVCGGHDVAGEPRMLYRCHARHMSFERVCSFGCRASRSGLADACSPRPPAPYCADEGLHCGGDRAEGDPGVLFRCVDHGLFVERVCPVGCVIDADGVADTCQ